MSDDPNKDAKQSAGQLPQECDSLEQVRVEIDRVDNELIALFGERAKYILRAAEIKSISGQPAFIPERVEAVVANVRNKAIAQGLDGEMFDAIWRQLVDEAIRREEKILGK